MDEQLREKIIEEVLEKIRTREGSGDAAPRKPAANLRGRSPDTAVSAPWPVHDAGSSGTGSGRTEGSGKPEFLIVHPKDPDSLRRMMSRTTARIGVGKCGPRLHTQTILKLRADHAAARDSVFQDADQTVLDSLGLFTVQTKCRDKQEFLTRPDLGRQLNDDASAKIRRECRMHPDVQVYASDGLSSAAVDANLSDILPILTDGLKEKGLSVGTPFYVRYGRVGVEDEISELLDAKVICVLLGERPGLATAESMSAYICWRATVGMPESRRTVVSNIHRNGISPVEAGAYICDVIEQIYRQQASGVELQKG